MKKKAPSSQAGESRELKAVGAVRTQKLLKAAEKVRDNAYAPSSGFKVGAALLTVAGKTYVGCNVENASYGLTCCAERNAVFAAVAAEGPGMRIVELAIATSPASISSPCGACRQVMYEFGPEAVVSKVTVEGLVQDKVSTLLPKAFGPQHLPRRST